MNPFSIATKGKGIFGTVKRANTIRRRYGLTPLQMNRQFSQFVRVLKQYGCGATFPITAIALARARGFVHKYQDQNIEFALHGYYHVDHTQLTLEQQLEYLENALEIIQDDGGICTGFRCPYLRWNEDTITAIRQAGFSYDSSQSLAWDVVDEVKTLAYERVLDFYGAIPANRFPALPHLENDLVRIPYCLPDDEALVERFQLSSTESMIRIWDRILKESYRLGELFTLGLHPERIAHCMIPLQRILQTARQLSPPVWFANLGDIASWWKDRTESRVTTQQVNDQEYELCVSGPKRITVLSRNVEMITPTVPWDGAFHRGPGDTIRFRADRRPFIGLSPSSPPHLASFLRQQGYIVESAKDSQNYTYFLDRPNFVYEDQRRLLEEIEQQDFPFVRLGRWPDGARSALCVTGDIDALTIWDYSMRLIGR